MSMAGSAFSEEGTLITHTAVPQTIDVGYYQTVLKNKDALSAPLDEEIAFLNQLADFELGRFLLINKGLNGYWTSYLILHGPQKTGLSDLETWVLHAAPAVRATQERFTIFRKILQDKLHSGMMVATIPCGVMDDLLGLDYTNLKNIGLVGIDLDPESLQLAKENAIQHKYNNVEFYKKNAWELGEESGEYDLITSNGLNIYEPDDAKVVQLYREFYKKLKVDGVLVTSFLTPPPALSTESSWKNFNPADALKQKVIFSDIIGVSWQAFRTEVQTRAQLEAAGFSVVEVVYDTQGMFPTIVAKKQS